MPRISRKNRPQLRRCNFCDRVGHNRSTCSDYLNSLKVATPPIEMEQMIKAQRPSPHFFIHHVDYAPNQSPHVVDLKSKQTAIWDQVETAIPHYYDEEKSLYHHYHELPKIKTESHQEKNTAKEQEDFSSLFTNFDKTAKPKKQKTTKADSWFKKFSIALKSKKANSALEIEPKVNRELLSPIPPQTALPEPIVEKKLPAPPVESILPAPPIPEVLPAPPVVEALPAPEQSRVILNYPSSPWVRPVQNTRAKKSKPNKTKKAFIHFITPRRAAIASVLIFSLIAVPGLASTYYRSLKDTKDSVMSNSTAGFASLLDSANALKKSDIVGAETATKIALNKLNSALDTLEGKHRILQNVVAALPIVGNNLSGKQKILEAGQQIASGNDILISGIKQITSAPEEKFTRHLYNISLALKSALPSYRLASTNLTNASPDDLPVEYQAEFNEFKDLFAKVVSDFQNLSDLSDSLQEIFGGSGSRKYLLIFQNEHELRATGGFMGSFALAEVKDGKIISLDVPAGGTYDLQGQLDAYVEPPTPLLITNKRWEFQDANWFPHFPATAEKIIWFYQHGRKTSVDGVIAINASVMERLLTLIGPLRDEKRNLTLTANNAITSIQKVVEEGPEKQINQPKQILNELAPQFLNSIQNMETSRIVPLLVSLQEALLQKEIQAYFTDKSAENSLVSFGWSGSIVPSRIGQDYLMVVNSNIQGQKSDAKIKQKISHQTIVSADGSITDTVTITRRHEGNSTEKLYGQPNIDFLRAYVPEGSELISAGGFTWPDDKSFRAPESWYTKDADLIKWEKETGLHSESGTRISNEFGKTAFGNWVVTYPGSETQAQFTYRLPFKVKPTVRTEDSWFNKLASTWSTGELSDLQLIVQRQSGCESEFDSQIIFPEGWRPIWKEGEEMSLARNGASIETQPLTRDSVWSLIMEKSK